MMRAEALAAHTAPAHIVPHGAAIPSQSGPEPSPVTTAASSVRMRTPERARVPYSGELPDPPSPTMLSEAAARSRSKATPAAVGPRHNERHVSVPQGAKQASKEKSAWTWRKSFSRPGSASGGSKPGPSLPADTLPGSVHNVSKEAAPTDAHGQLHEDMQAPPSLHSHEADLLGVSDTVTVGQQPTDQPMHATHAANVPDHVEDVTGQQEADSKKRTPQHAAGPTGLDEETSLEQHDSSAAVADVRNEPQREQVNAETGLTAAQHQQLLDEGHFGGWSSSNGIIRRDPLPRAKSGADAFAEGGRLGSRQNSRDLGPVGSSPERRSFWESDTPMHPPWVHPHLSELPHP